MPKKVQVEVTVSVSNASNGKLDIKIKPWRIHLDPGDTVEWVPVKRNGKTPVKWLRINTVAHTDPWPFDEAPPDQAYTGDDTKNAKTPHGRKSGLTVGSVVPYTIEIAFNDTDGNERWSSVDPDMVMD